MIEPQYIDFIEKGFTVTYGKGDCRKYKVQDDGKGFLHIIVYENGKRKKVALKDVNMWFEYGSETDWIFNGWFQYYDYETFKQFALCEKNAA